MSSERFITLEGIDGSGKTTIANLLQKHLAQQNIQAILVQDPGTTELGNEIRTLLKTRCYDIPNLSELFLFMAARHALIEQQIKPALAKGHWVISDRFIHSTYAYQGAGRGIDEHQIDSLITLLDHPPIDHIILLDIKPKTALSRKQNSTPLDSIPDHFDQQSLDFMEQVRTCYLKLAQAKPDAFSIFQTDQMDLKTLETHLSKLIQNLISSHSIS